MMRNRVGIQDALVLGVLAIGSSLWIATSEAQVTSSGLGTQVTVSPGNFEITGGTRPGNGSNLFHSFGDFSVGSSEVAGFLNDSGLATTNILGRVTGGNVSSIFGEINTTDFGPANLYLINPAGVVFGDSATLNVTGSVSVSTADYIGLSDGRRFTAEPIVGEVFSSAPVTAFGFLSAAPEPISVNGAVLEVGSERTLSLIGGDITITGGGAARAKL